MRKASILMVIPSGEGGAHKTYLREKKKQELLNSGQDFGLGIRTFDSQLILSLINVMSGLLLVVFNIVIAKILFNVKPSFRAAVEPNFQFKTNF